MEEEEGQKGAFLFFFEVGNDLSDGMGRDENREGLLGR